MDADPQDAMARYYLGNFFYDRRRHREAIDLWQQSAAIDPTFSIVWRNLGIGYFNVLRNPDRAVDAYDRAHRCAPNDARVFYERDQLWKRVGCPLDKRLAELEARDDLVASRDDSASNCRRFSTRSAARETRSRFCLAGASSLGRAEKGWRSTMSRPASPSGAPRCAAATSPRPATNSNWL